MAGFAPGDATDEVLRRLSRAPVLAVGGPPGIGKSRTLDEVARRWSGDVLRCDLTNVAEAVGITERVAVAAGFGRSPEPTPTALFGRRSEPLLVLDHADHATAVLGGLMQRWTDTVPALRCLAGSRVRIPEVDTVPLDGLDLDAAVALLRRRAEQVGGPSDLPRESLEALARAVDGNPLALELAGARLRLVAPDALVARLSELSDPRKSGPHRSLESAMALSRDLLDPAQRAALAAACVFRGTFDEPGFREVTGASSELLESLLDASLVQVVSPGRMRVYPTVVASAAALQDPATAREVAERHVAFSLARGEAVRPRFPDRNWSALEALREDLGVVRGTGGRDAVRAAILLTHLGYAVGPIVDATSGLGAVPDDLVNPLARARLQIRHALWDADGCLAAAEEMRIPDPDPTDRHVRLYALAKYLTMRLRFDEARQALDEWHATGQDATFTQRIWMQQAEWQLHLERGDREAALAALMESQGLIDRAGAACAFLQPNTWMLLGVHHVFDPERAVGFFERAIASQRKSGKIEVGYLRWLASAWADLGMLDRAAAVAEEAAGPEHAPDDRVAGLLVLAGIRMDREELGAASAALGEARALAGGGPHFGPLRAHEALLASLEGRSGDAVAGYRAALAERWVWTYSFASFPWRAFEALALGPERGLAALDEAGAEAARIGHPMPLFLSVVREALTGGLGPATRRAAEAIPSAALRRLLALASGGFRVASDGAWFERPGTGRVALGRRAVLKRFLAALAEAGAGNVVPREALLDRIWPDEQMLRASADARLYVAANSLRTLGLGEALVTAASGGPLAYGLAPSVRIEPA